MKRKTRMEKGITLIALIITIVVLMILAAVAISSITNDGILEHAQNAAGTYNQAVKNEHSMLQEYEDHLTGINGGFEAYDIGDTITLTDNKGRTHDFWVIAESDETQSKVTLMAKDYINVDKTNKNYLTQGYSEDCVFVAFSEDNYWADEEGNILAEYKPILDKNENTVGYDLREKGIPNEKHYAAYAAYQYGVQFGVTTGRLLTYSEAEELYVDNSNAIGADSFWLSCAATANDVWYNDFGSIESSTAYNDGWYVGVCPVVEISKSKIS